MVYRHDSDFDVKVNEVSAKSYVLNPNVKRKFSGHMSTATFEIDYQVSPSLDYNDEIKIDYGYVGSLTNKFYGLISSIEQLENKKLSTYSYAFFDRRPGFLVRRDYCQMI